MITLLKSTESLKNLQVLERNKSFSQHSTEDNTPKPDPQAIKFLKKVDKRHKFIELYIKIFYLSRKRGYAYASDKTLAEAIGVSLRSLKSYISKLEKLGVIYRITDKTSVPYRRKIYLSDLYKSLNELKKCLRGQEVAQYSYLHSSDKKHKITSLKEGTGGFKEASPRKEEEPPNVVLPPTKSGKGSWQQKGSLRHQFKTPKNIEILEQKEKMRFSHNEKVRLTFISESKIQLALEIFKQKIKKGFRPKGRWERYFMGIIDKLLQKEGIQIATPTFYAYLEEESPDRKRNLPGYVPKASQGDCSTKPNVVNPISIGNNVKYSQSVSRKSAENPPQLFPGEAGSSSIFEAKSDMRPEPTPPDAPKTDSKASRIDYLCKKVSRYLKSIGCGNRLVIGRNYIEVDFGHASPSSYIRFDDPDFDRHFDELASRIGMPKNYEVAHL